MVTGGEGGWLGDGGEEMQVASYEDGREDGRHSIENAVRKRDTSVRRQVGSRLTGVTTW